MGLAPGPERPISTNPGLKIFVTHFVLTILCIA